MKNSLLLSALAAVALTSLTAQADAQCRKWDFTKWSATTQSNLQAGSFANTNSTTPEAGWSDVEKSSGTAPTDISANNCFWQVSHSYIDADGNLLANGAIIEETQGLKYTNSADRSLAIALNYPSTSLGDYNGPAYLWLGSSKKSYFTIPNVPADTKIDIGIESHKPSEARGVNLYVGSTSGTQLNDPDGNAVATPTTYEDQVFYVPTDLTDTPNEDGTYNIVIYNTNGCHLYYIQVGEDGGSEMDDIKIGYLYDSSYNGAKDADKNPVGYAANGGLDLDPIYAVLSSYDVTPIDYSTLTMTSEELNDSLLSFDVVVASEAVSSGNKYAKGLVDIVNKVPMLNLKSFMYKSGVWSWGAGSNPSPKANTIKVNEDYMDDALFADIEMDEEGQILLFNTTADDAPYGNLVQGYTVSEGSLIASDDVIATVSGINAIHAHGTKNEYMLIPLSSDNLIANGDFNLTDAAMILVGNAVKILAGTKSKVQNAAAPVISQQHSDGLTEVSISCVTPGSTIYYTTDGTDPTTASAVYAEPFTVTEDGVVVKAFAVAHGYNDSSIATATISVQSQNAAPAIDVEGNTGSTTITLTTDEEGGNIFFNYQGLTDQKTSQLYTEPIVLCEPATITAFVTSSAKLQSEAVSQEITVGGIPAVKDTVAHFNAGETDWYTNAVLTNDSASFTPAEAVAAGVSSGSASAFYYFGKSAWNYYSDEVDHTEAVVDEEGNPVKDINGNDSIRTIYKPNPASVKTITSTSDTQWMIRTQGQVVTGELQLAPATGVGNGETGRYAETAADAIGQPTKGVVDFGGKTSGEPYTMTILSTEKFTAPFDVVTYLGNGSTGSPYIEVEISEDGENWQTVDSLLFAGTQRYWKKTRLHIAEAGSYYVQVKQVGGSSKAQLYDIYVISTEGETGIEQVAADAEVRSSELMFDLYGRTMQAPVQGQLFIRNGKKMIVR